MVRFNIIKGGFWAGAHLQCPKRDSIGAKLSPREFKAYCFALNFVDALDLQGTL